MALLKLDPGAIAQTIGTTAAARAAMAVAQSASPKLVRDVQRVLSTASWIDGILGTSDIRDMPTPLLGGLTLKQAQHLYEQSSAVRAARKNLFFIRISDKQPPTQVLQAAQRPTRASLSGLIESRIGPAIGSLAGSAVNAARSIGLDAQLAGNSVANIAGSTIDLLAIDVSYSEALIGDSIQIGGSFIDRVTGRQPVEMQITTMDDEAGSLKRWFKAKLEQVARPDGTFGLPNDYAVDIEVFHAIPGGLPAEQQSRAYSVKRSMRAVSSQHDLSRRDQALAELQMVFTEVDPFMNN